MNKYMHPKNPYKNRTDFRVLGARYPAFAALLDQNGRLDFSNREHSIMLTKCLLKRDYNVEIEFPINSLSPSLSLKMNYLLWIEDLLLTNENLKSVMKAEPKKILGIDIGTGGAVLFPILSAKHFGWSMLATEINEEDCEMARHNLRSNGMENQITVLYNPNKDSIFDVFHETNGRFMNGIVFTMTNPPFYDTEDYDEIAHAKEECEIPQMAAAGRKHEMTTDGGEVNFVMKILKESKLYKTNIKIFTVMLGRKRSANEIKQVLKNDTDVKSVALSEFCQGRIMRWGLAWTFDSQIILEQAIPSAFSRSKQQQKTSTPFIISVQKGTNLVDSVGMLKIVSELLSNHLMAKNIANQKVHKDVCVVRFKLFSPTWRNQRSKRRQADRMLEGPSNKKRKLETVDVDNVNTEIQLDVLLTINTKEIQDIAPKIELQFVCKDGALGRGGLYELVQYFKNKLNAT